MKFKIKIKNLGKVSQSDIRVAPFTVIAGANSSGKSFVTKALYSFFSTINKDHVTNVTILNAQRALALLNSIKAIVNSPSTLVMQLWEETHEQLQEFQIAIQQELGAYTFLDQKAKVILLDEKIDNIRFSLEQLIVQFSGKKKYSSALERAYFVNKLLMSLRTSLRDPTKILTERIENGFKEALKENFQVPNLNDLKSFSALETEEIVFNFGKLGRINISGEEIDFDLTPEGIDEFQSLYNVVFIESPIYWKLRKPLSKSSQLDNFNLYSSRRKFSSKPSEYLSGVPKYFFDLISLVEKNIKTNNENVKLKKLKEVLDEIINGDLDITDSGDIVFNDKESSKTVSLNTTASGVTNLGLLGLLLKRNIIAEGSFIFVDEPEVNLHPAWQKCMIEILYALSQCGINVVIASHSLDMMKYIENIMNSHPKDKLKDDFAINWLSKDSLTQDDTSDLRILAAIKEDLGKPFFDMMLDSEW